MTRYRPYSRRELDRRFVQWARRHAKAVLILTGGMLGLTAFATVTFVVAFSHTPIMWWSLGAIQVALLATYLHFLNAAFLANDAKAVGHLRGAWGEENTRSELQRARRKRLIWGWVDSITLQVGDIDHLVVTRNGGLVAVDSKWRNQATDKSDMAAAANKARLRAEGVTNTLLKAQPGARHRSKMSALKVTPIVVLWGAAQEGVPVGARVDDVEFVSGRRLIDWLADFEGHQVDEAAAADVLRRLNAYRASTWINTRT